MDLHPEAVAFLDAEAARGRPPVRELDPVTARALVADAIGERGPSLAVHAIRPLKIPVAGGDVAARLYEPVSARGTILWLHGGGWVFDGLEACDAACRLLANASGATVVSVDYRVAPEHRYPAAAADSEAAMRYMAAKCSPPFAVAGDSAGGNLAAVCAQSALADGEPRLAAQLLVYPVTDCDMTTESYRVYAEDDRLLLDGMTMRWFWDHYAPAPESRTETRASPLRAASLAGLPPAIVVIAEHDPLRDEGLEYARRLGEAGVPVTLDYQPDMPHAFFTQVNVLQRANETVARAGNQLRTLIAAA